MIQPTHAKIFLANERGCNENGHMRSCSTFNFGQFNSAYKQSFGHLTVWNDDTIAPGHSIKMHIKEDCFVIYLPMVGTITCKDSTDSPAVVSAGEVYVMNVRGGSLVEVSNHLQDALVNFLHIRISTALSCNSESNALLRFNIDQEKNQLALMEPVYGKELVEQLPFYIGVAKLDGRQEIEYAVNEPGNGVFVFVVSGAFEVQNRLLHERDGLALWNSNGVEAEALSNEAVLVILEIPVH